MRIGKNELEIMRILDGSERGRMRRKVLKYEFKPDCNNQNYKTKAFSRALHSLTEKGLVMTYAEIGEGGPWKFDGWGRDSYGNEVMLMRKPYDGKMKYPYTPHITMCIGLTEKGELELQKRL